MKTKDFTSNQAFFFIYFFIVFFGSTVWLEEYLFEDDLPIVYSMILGLASAIIAGTIIYFIKHSKTSIKALWGVVLLVVAIALNMIVS